MPDNKFPTVVAPLPKMKELTSSNTSEGVYNAEKYGQKDRQYYGDITFGDSQYDKSIVPSLLNQNDVDYLRSEHQGFFDKLANSGVNLVGKSTAYLGQTAGFILGAPVALATWDITNMTDNFIDRASDELKDKVSEDFPIYHSKKYTEGTIWNKLGTQSWWLDDAMDRAALTVSMLVPGMLASKGFGLAGIISNGLESVAPETLKGLGTALEYAVTAAKAGKPLEGVTPELVNFAKTLTKSELFTQNILSQAGLSSRETQLAIKKELTESRSRGENHFTDEEIQSKSVDGAINVFWQNVPVALLSSAVELPQIFSTFNTGKNLFKKAFDSFGNPLTIVEKTLGQKIGSGVLKALGTGLEHGQVENLQVAIGKYNEDLLEGKTHDNISDGILKAFVDDFTDANGQNNIALGTIQGILTSALGGFGRAKRIAAGKEISEEGQIKHLQEFVNGALLNYKDVSGQYVKKDSEGKTIIDSVTKQPIQDIQKITSDIIGMYGAIFNNQNKTMAVADLNKFAADWADHNALMGLAFGHFGINGGKEHLENLMTIERDETKKNPDHVNDTDMHGNEITPDQVLEEKKNTLQRLYKVYNIIQGVKVDLGDGSDMSKEDKERAAKFINQTRFTLYHTAATQLFLSKQKEGNNAELADMESVIFGTAINQARIKELNKQNDSIDELSKYYTANYDALLDKKELKNLFQEFKPQDEEITNQPKENANAKTVIDQKKKDLDANEVIKQKLKDSFYSRTKNATTKEHIKDLSRELKESPLSNEEKSVIQKVLQDKDAKIAQQSTVKTTEVIPTEQVIETTNEEKTSLTTNIVSNKEEKPDGYIDDVTPGDKKTEEENINVATIYENTKGEEISPQGMVITDGDLIIQAGSSLAYLTKGYVEELVKRGKDYVHKVTTATDKLNDMQEPLLLSQEHYQPGEVLTLELDTAFNVTVDEETGVIQNKDKSVPLTQKKNITYADLADDPMRVPIRIVNSAGKTVAYLHDIDYITPRRVGGGIDNISEQHTILTAIRNVVFNAKGVATKIISKSIGKLSKTFDGKERSTKEAIKNPNIKFAISRNNSLYINEGEQLVTPVMNTKFRDGLTYMIVPTPVKDKNIALPVYNTTINEEKANQLANVVELFLKKDNDKVRDDIKTLTSLNVYTSDGLRAYLKLFTVVGDFNQGTINGALGSANRVYLDVVSTGIKWGRTGEDIRDINKIEYFNREDFISTIKDAYVAIYKANLDIKSYKTPTLNNDGTINNVEQTYTEFIKANTTTNIVENDLGGGEFSYFDQSVINFDLSPFIKSDSKGELVALEEGQKIEDNIEELPDELGLINLDDVDLLPVGKVELSSDIVNKIVESSLLVKGFDAYKQSEIVSIFSKYILDKSKGEEAVPIAEIKSGLLDIFNKYQKAYSAKSPKLADEFGKILSNFDKFFKITQVKLEKFNISSEGNIKEESEFENYDDNRTFQIDAKDKMSAKLKQFFSFMEHTDKSYIGLTKYLAFDDVINYLSGQLAGIESNYGKMRAKLEESAKSVVWLNNVISALDKSDEQTKNQFTSWASKHFANFKMVLHAVGVEKKGGSIQMNEDGSPVLNYSTTVIDVNQNSISKVIEEQWFNNLKLTKLAVVSDVNPGELALDNTALKELHTEYETLDKTSIEPIKAWLNKLGIEVSTKTLNDLKDSKRGLKWDQQFDSASGIFYNIANRLIKGEKEEKGIDSFDLNNPFVGNTAVSKLAKIEAIHTSAHFSNSHKDGEGKSIYNYIQNKYFTNAFRDIVNNDKDIVSKLLALPFSSTSIWLNDLAKPGENAMKEVFDFFYIDTLKKQMGDQDGIKLKDMSSREQELFRMSLFFNKGKKFAKTDKRIINAIAPTLSDKSNLMGITTIGHNTEVNFDKNGLYTLGTGTIDALYAIIDGEYKRILAHQNDPKQLNIDGYNPKLFYFFEELNDAKKFPELWQGGKLRQSTAEGVVKVKEYLQDYTRELIHRKLQYWNDNQFIEKGKLKYFDKSYLTHINGKLEIVTPQNQAVYTASDYIVNTLIGNANFFQVFAGDPALFYKKVKGINESEFKQHINESWINVGKRLASMIAPGTELADSDNNNYIQIFLQDRESISKNIDQLDKLFANNKKLADKYRKINGTDAQEYTTIKEHLYVLEKLGTITADKAKTLLNKANNHTLDPHDTDVIFQPMKPVYVQRIIENGVARLVYIKSSSFPLVPQLVKGTELDKLRIGMEKLEEKHVTTVRASYKSAVKLGGSQYSNIYNDDGTIKDELDFTDSMIVLPRSGFRIQQDVPFDVTKDEINRGTQEAKLLFANILGVEGMENLQTQYHEIYNRLFEKGKVALIKELGVEQKNGQLKYDPEKLQTKLIKEAISRDWPQNDIDALSLIQADKFNKVFALPLWSLTSSNAIESLLASVVDNTIRKQKLRGNSYVLGSEEGFTGDSRHIIYTKEYNKETGLLPQRYSEDGKTVLPAQILLPNKFRNKQGDLIDLKKFIGEDGLLDSGKFDSKLLEQFGFRIPTQGHNSMSYMQVVGFLPAYVGDLIIASRDFTVQMGSDFDVDKIYAYMYKTKIEGGKLVLDEEAKDINDLLDIHLKVVSNSDKKVQRSILEPLGYGNLEKLAEDIDKMKTARKDQFSITPLSDEYQKDKYLKGRVSTSGRGAKSLDSTFSATVQGKSIKLAPILQEDGTYLTNHLIFGTIDKEGKVKNIEKNDLSSETAVDGGDKLQTHAAYQSAAVDNEKMRIMERVNSGPLTYAAERALAQVGFTENFIAPMMSQDIMDDYITELTKGKDSLVDKFDADKEGTVIQGLEDKYISIGNIDVESNEYKTYNNPDYPLTQKEMMDCIEQGTNLGAKSYALIQLATLNKFLKTKAIGESIAKIQRVINIDSSGIPSHLFDAFDIQKEFNESILRNGLLTNTLSLVGERQEDGSIKPTTIPGMALIHGLFVNNKLWNETFPYNQDGIVDIFDETTKLFNKKGLTVDDKYKIFNDVKSFVYSNEQLFLNNENLRGKLFFDTKDNKSLATRIKALQGTTKNLFIKWLEVEINKTGKQPSLVKYNAGTALNLDELDMYQGFADLFAKEDTAQLGIDMVNYFFMSGGIQQAIQFGRYIPNAYLLNTPFADMIRNTTFLDDSVLGNVLYNKGLHDVSKFGKQFMQHNPNRAKRIESDLSQITNLIKDKGKVIGFKVKEGEANALLVTRIMENGSIIKIYPEFLALKDNKENKKLNQFQLFEYIGDNKYRAVDTLGKFGYDEWQYNETNAKSKIEVNQVKELQIPDVKNLVSGIDISTEQKIVNPNRAESLLEQHGMDEQTLAVVDGKDVIHSFLNNTKNNSESPANKVLAEVLGNNIHKTGGITIKISKDKNLKASYTYGKNGSGIITINPDNIIGTLALEQAILHETIHHFTGHIVKMKAEDRTKDQNAIVNALVKLQKDLLNAINKDPIWKDEFDKFVEAYNTNKGIDDLQISKNYGAMKLTEFITMALTDSNFQKILNNIPSSSKNTMLSRFLDLIKRALRSLGIDIKSGSILEGAIDQSLQLIDTNVEKQLDEVTESKETDFIPNPNDLGTTVGEFLQTMSSEDRATFRKMLAEGKFKIKCN